MNWQTITIDGIPPSKKNSKRSFLLSSDAYLKWEKSASIMMAGMLKPVRRCELKVHFLVNGGRKFDLDNKVTSIIDCLVKSGIIKDDNYDILYGIEAKFFDTTQDSRTEIMIGETR